MIHDATIEVTCDGDECNSHILLRPEYVYSDYSGNSGHYDTKDSSLNQLIEDEGWSVSTSEEQNEDDKHYCKSCTDIIAKRG